MNHYRAIWISDVHLGTAGCQAKYLLDFLKHNDADKIYLVGDIIDGWNAPIDTRNRQVSRQYNKQTTNVVDEPVATSTAKKETAKPKINPLSESQKKRSAR